MSKATSEPVFTSARLNLITVSADASVDRIAPKRTAKTAKMAIGRCINMESSGGDKKTGGGHSSHNRHNRPATTGILTLIAGRNSLNRKLVIFCEIDVAGALQHASGPPETLANASVLSPGRRANSARPESRLLVLIGEKGSDTQNAKHPSGRSGFWCLTRFRQQPKNEILTRHLRCSKTDCPVLDESRLRQRKAAHSSALDHAQCHALSVRSSKTRFDVLPIPRGKRRSEIRCEKCIRLNLPQPRVALNHIAQSSRLDPLQLLTAEPTLIPVAVTVAQRFKLLADHSLQQTADAAPAEVVFRQRPHPNIDSIDRTIGLAPVPRRAPGRR